MDIRHGDGSHFMRPDRVYRTGVLAPMMGYQPQRDVNEVAMNFTQPGRTVMLSGFGQPNVVQRIGLRIKAAMAERRARKFMALSGLGMGVPAPAMVPQISPHLATQMTGVLSIMGRSFGPGYPASAADWLVNRPLRSWYR